MIYSYKTYFVSVEIGKIENLHNKTENLTIDMRLAYDQMITCR